MAISFKYKVGSPGDFDQLVAEAKAQAKASAASVREAALQKREEGDEKGYQALKALMGNPELFLSKILTQIVERGELKNPWQVVDAAEMYRILSEIQNPNGELVHPNGPPRPVGMGSRPPASVRPASPARPPASPRSARPVAPPASSIPTREEVREIFRKLYPRFVQETQGS